MGYIQISTNMPDHPAFLSLPPRGCWAWVASICWLSRNGRRDSFPRHLARTFDATPKVHEALIRAGLWVDEGEDVWVPQWVESYWGRPQQLWKFGPLEVSRPKIPLALRLAVYERDNNTCLHCGSTEDLSLDHIHPFSLGGPDTLDNLQTLCRPCNSRKGARV